MVTDLKKIELWKEEMIHHLTKELFLFWKERCRDDTYAGFLTQFDTYGDDSGIDEKSLLAHMCTIYFYHSHACMDMMLIMSV